MATQATGASLTDSIVDATREISLLLSVDFVKIYVFDLPAAEPTVVRVVAVGVALRCVVREVVVGETTDVDVTGGESAGLFVHEGDDNPLLEGDANRIPREWNHEGQTDGVGYQPRSKQEGGCSDEQAAVEQFVGRWLATGEFALDAPEGIPPLRTDQQEADQTGQDDQQDHELPAQKARRHDQPERVEQRDEQQQPDVPIHITPYRSLPQTPFEGERRSRRLAVSGSDADRTPLTAHSRSEGMDDAADLTKVEWHDWGQEAFDVADQSGKPVLLAVVTSWSGECREMDRTTYAEPRIAANINDGFVPVRVDADRHPRVRERYNMGAFPSTVFTTPDGTILTGATFLGVDGFRSILDRVRETWDTKGEEAGSVPRALADGKPPAGSVDERVEEAMVEQLLAAYDDEFGGWGSDVKFPLPRTIEFALVRARDQATRTLEAIQTHLLDTYDGGFYRFARNRNWGSAQREKLLDENAALVRAFAHGYRYTGQNSYRESAERGAEYLTTTLWTGDAFAASQGGDTEYFTLEPADREDAEAPPVDGTVLADRNGLAVDALLTLVSYTDDEELTRYARRAREHVCETLVGAGNDDAGRVTHFQTAEETGESGLLLDQARVLAGLATSWSVLGEHGPARAVADWTIDNLQTESGAFHDGPTEGAGLLDQPLYPLDTTAEFADALLDIAALTGEDRYREVAREAIESFAGAANRMGVEVAHYATVAARLRDPRRIEVGAAAGSDLHRAALRLADHETVVVPDATDSHGVDEGATRVVADGEIEGSAASPADLEAVLTDGE